MLYFLGAKHPLSHLHPSTFAANGTTYNTSEQYYQHAKAKLGRDHKAAGLIMEAADGYQQKQLSKQIRNGHKFYWERAKFYVMLRAEYEKYTQNIKLRTYLLETAPRYLQEDNKYDKYWAGKSNQSGRILMSLRSGFAAGALSSLPEIFVIGDSMARSVSEEALSARVKKNVVVLAFPGALLEYLMEVALYVCGPFCSKVIVFGGTNNLGDRENKPRMNPDKLAEKVEKFTAEFVRVHNTTKIMFCSVINRPRCSATRMGSHIERYNNHFLNMPDCDVDFLNLGYFNDALFTDSVHLNTFGTKLVFEKFCNVLTNS